MDRPELREKEIASVLRNTYYHGRAYLTAITEEEAVKRGLAKILALIIPDIEEAKKQLIAKLCRVAVECRKETQEAIKKNPRKTWRLCVDRIIGEIDRCGKP